MTDYPTVYSSGIPMPHPLTVYSCNHPMTRMGRDYDGGYVMVEGLYYDHFLSGGIADDNSFERDVLAAHPSLACEAFDPSCDGGGARPPRFHFHREPVSLLGLDWARDALVKLDIEGDEWDWLKRAPMSHVAQLVIELHSPHLDRWSWPVLEWLNTTHKLVHLHGNNWDGMVEVGGVRMPGTIECTYVREDRVGETWLNTRAIPGPLDMPNRPGVPDHVIDWPPFCWGVS